MQEKIFIARKEADGCRIDKWLADEGDWSRAQVQRWIKDGQVMASGQKAKANDKMNEGDKVHVHIPDLASTAVAPEAISLDIIFEDEDVIVVNKPQGMVVHPAPGHTSGTLVNALLSHCDTLSDINGAERPGIVHRIDKDTSGLLMAAKNNAAHEDLAQQLQNKTVSRTYKAIVHGVIAHDQGTIDAPIGRDEKDRKKMAVTRKNSKHAVTAFTVLQRFRQYTYVACQLKTGRTHQIRVHMKYIGHPVAGDPKYGPNKTLPLQGQALHAAILAFDHPKTGERLQFEAQLPAAMAHLC